MHLKNAQPLRMQTAEAEQLDFFSVSEKAPLGFRFERNAITENDESLLLARLPLLPFREFQFHGYTGKRRTVSFGWKYDFDQERALPAEPFPEFLLPLRHLAGEFAGVSDDAIEQATLIEYGSGAGIGWHRDKGLFDKVVGLSLGSPCQFRLRRQVENKWERYTVTADPRSIYLLDGPARNEWEHSVPPVASLRYALTFRTRRRHLF